MDKKTKREWVILILFGVSMIFMVILLAIFGKSSPIDEEFQEYFEEYVQKNGELGAGISRNVEIPGIPKHIIMSVTKHIDEKKNSINLIR